MDEERDERQPEEILLAAVDALPVEDRQLVLTWLLARLGSGAPDLAALQRLVPQAHLVTGGRERAAAMIFEHSQATLSEDQRVVPVRFSADQHAALQAWCQEHGFSMATVIRGLVARFLEERA